MSGFWSRRNPRERVLLVLCLLALVVGVPLLLTPPSPAGGRLLPAREARLKYQSALEEKLALEQALKQLKPRIAEMAYSKPPEELVPQAVRTLQKHARDSGIHLREIRPLKAKRIAGVMKVPLTVRFSTTDFARGVVPFLYRVEDPAGRLVLDKVNITAPDAKSRTLEVEAQVAFFTQSAEEGEAKS